MSYTGVGTIGSHVAHEPASPDDSGMVAARDITRLNGIGQLVVMVPKGQPIPNSLADDAKSRAYYERNREWVIARVSAQAMALRQIRGRVRRSRSWT